MAAMAQIQGTGPQAVSGFRRLAGHTDLLLAAGVVLIIALMVVPIPPLVLDLLLSANITMAVLILMVSMYLLHPLELSVFPGLLLLLTLFRLGLNVASTRLILGEGYAGDVIAAFGSFVVQGNYAVGFIIFLILVVIQFVVIVKGAGRIAEVAARFTLDGMPGNRGVWEIDQGQYDREEVVFSACGGSAAYRCRLSPAHASDTRYRQPGRQGCRFPRHLGVG